MEEIRQQLKYYNNLLDRLGKKHYSLNKKFHYYEIVLLRIRDNNDKVLS